MKRTKTAAYAASLAALVSTGCAITSSHHSGPNGQPVHFIDGMSASVAYQKASELCPNGYTILGAPEMKTVLDYVMTIECKPRVTTAVNQPGLAAPSVTVTTKQPRNIGRYSSEAENLPEVRACNPYPPATLVAQGTGFENYTIPCSNGDVVSVRCERIGCRVLQ